MSKITLTFEIDVDGDRSAALDRRDEIIDALKSHGIDLVLTDDGTRVVMYDHGEELGSLSTSERRDLAERAESAKPRCSHPEFALGHCGEIACPNYYGKT